MSLILCSTPRVDRLAELYVNDLQDPATRAVLDADDAVVLTASPEFMAKPWLLKYLRVPNDNVYGAKIGVRNDRRSTPRFTGSISGELPIGQAKVELLRQCPPCLAPGARLTGYGDHPTDVPFLEECSRGVLVYQPGHDLPMEQRGGCILEEAMPFEGPLEPTPKLPN